MKAVLFVCFGLAVFGAVCLVRSPMVLAEARDVRVMTCAEFLKNGAGDDRYVTLSGLYLSAGDSVGERDGDTGAVELYHPLYSVHLIKEPPPRELGLILCILDETERRRIRDDREERKRVGRGGLSKLTLEIRSPDTIPRWAQKGLKAKYPGIPLPQCRVLALTGYEPTPARAARLLFYGLASVAGAATLFVGWCMWRRIRGRESAEAQEPATPLRDSALQRTRSETTMPSPGSFRSMEASHGENENKAVAEEGAPDDGRKVGRPHQGADL
jgi:hypothetical protein